MKVVRPVMPQMGPLTPNEVGRMAQHVRDGRRRKEVIRFATSQSSSYPIVLTRLGGPRSNSNPLYKL